jgi:ribonuclease P protein component
MVRKISYKKLFGDCRHETYLSTQQAGPQAPPRFSRPHGHQERRQGRRPPPRQGQKASDGLGSLDLVAAALKTLKKRREFLAASACGQSAGSKGAVLQIKPKAPTEQDLQAYGLTASRKVGNAVMRNRAKRRLRALAREILPERAILGHDYVLIARTETVTRDFALLRGDLLYMLRKLNALKKLSL